MVRRETCQRVGRTGEGSFVLHLETDHPTGNTKCVLKTDHDTRDGIQWVILLSLPPAFTVGRRPIVCAKRLLFAQRSAAGGLRGRLAGRHPPGGPPEANPTLYTFPRNVHLFQRNWGGPWLVHRISFQKAHGEKDCPTISAPSARKVRNFLFSFTYGKCVGAQHPPPVFAL